MATFYVGMYEYGSVTMYAWNSNGSYVCPRNVLEMWLLLLQERFEIRCCIVNYDLTALECYLNKKILKIHGLL